MFNIDELRSAFTYKDGKLYWTSDRGTHKLCGVEASHICKKSGYVRIKYKNKVLIRSRVVFAIHNGFWPDEIDHINRIRHDDRIENLRNANRTLNNNNKHTLDNCVGITRDGISWRAQISINNKKVHLGNFRNIEDAKQAYKKAKMEKWKALTS